MCWGVPAVVMEVDESGMIAKVDFGDGVEREVLIGISSDRISRGDIVIVHAGVVISKLSYEGFLEYVEFLREVVGEGSEELLNTYYSLTSLAKLIKGDHDG